MDFRRLITPQSNLADRYTDTVVYPALYGQQAGPRGKDTVPECQYINSWKSAGGLTVQSSHHLAYLSSQSASSSPSSYSCILVHSSANMAFPDFMLDPNVVLKDGNGLLLFLLRASPYHS
jgi:hypothetical protein